MRSAVVYGVQILPRAQRQIKALPRDVQKRIVKAVRLLRENPRPSSVKKLKGTEDLYRYRVGSYRIIYAVSDEAILIFVVSVGHRREVYRELSAKYTAEYLRSLTRDQEP